MQAIGFLIYFICGLWGLFLSFQIVDSVFGEVAAFLSLLVAPALLGIAPLYALFANGDWLPLAVTYGGGLIGAVFVGMAD